MFSIEIDVVKLIINLILVVSLLHLIHILNESIMLYLLATGENGIVIGLESFPPVDEFETFLPMDDQFITTLVPLLFGH